jgi:gliding motility-associated-like protein
MYVNSSDQMILFGTANCSDFPVTQGAYDTSLYDLDDLFITIFNPAGTAIVASTYIGGEGFDGYSDRFYFNSGDGPRGELICDAQDNIYVATCSFSSNFPVTPNAYQPTLHGGSDAVVFKMSKMLDTLIWSTYLGGSSPATGGDEAAYSLVLDPQKNVYVTGATTSNNYPTTPGVLNPAFPGGHTKGFVAKINSNGTSLMTSSYIGTTMAEETQCDFIARDTDGDIYLYGWEQGGNYPVQNAAFSNANTGMFIHKMNAGLSNTVYSTTFGQDTVPNLSPSAFMVDECEHVYVAGWGGDNFFAGTTNGMPVTANAYDAITDGGDMWLAVFASDMNSMLYGTFFGGEPWSNADHEHTHGGSSRFASDGTLYHAVCANCSGGLVIPYPTTPGAPFSAANPDGCSNAVFKFALPFGGATAQFQMNASNPPCTVPYTVTFNQTGNASDSAYYLWSFGDGNTLTTTSDSAITYTYTVTGSYTIKLVVVDTVAYCGPQSDTFTLVLNITPGALVSCSNDTAICIGDSVQLSASGNGQYTWSPGTSLSCIHCSDPRASPGMDTKYFVTVTDANGCSGQDSVTVKVWPLPIATAFPNAVIAKGTTVQLQATGGSSYNWSPASGLNCTDCSNPIAKPDQNTVYCVQVTDTNQCTDTACVTIRLKEEQCGTIFMANAFSPNDDGDNDAIFPQGKCLRIILFSVYSRWGELLYSHNTKGWDGTFKGEPMPIGTYMYYTTYLNNTGEQKDMKGDFTLVR